MATVQMLHVVTPASVRHRLQGPIPAVTIGASQTGAGQVVASLGQLIGEPAGSSQTVAPPGGLPAI
jgi:hypothetical protein